MINTHLEKYYLYAFDFPPGQQRSLAPRHVIRRVLASDFLLKVDFPKIYLHDYRHMSHVAKSQMENNAIDAHSFAHARNLTHLRFPRVRRRAPPHQQHLPSLALLIRDSRPPDVITAARGPPSPRESHADDDDEQAGDEQRDDDDGEESAVRMPIFRRSRRRVRRRRRCRRRCCCCRRRRRRNAR